MPQEDLCEADNFVFILRRLLSGVSRKLKRHVCPVRPRGSGLRCKAYRNWCPQSELCKTKDELQIPYCMQANSFSRLLVPHPTVPVTSPVESSGWQCLTGLEARNRSPFLDVEVNILLEHRVDCRLDEAIPFTCTNG